MLTLDGSQGEGGGQILRSSLSLSLVTGMPFRIENIRGGRRKPGVLRQHRTAIVAAAAVGGASFTGGEVGDSFVEFHPGTIRPGEFEFAVGTAGSTTLVLQTVLPALITAEGPSTVVLEGGTHNPWSPPFEFLHQAFLPLLARMGPRADLTLERAGFHPAGGGRLQTTIRPAPTLDRLELTERGETKERRGRALVANLPRAIGTRETKVLEKRLGWTAQELRCVELEGSRGPGNVVLCELESEHVTEVFTAFGMRGKQAEDVARSAADQVRDYLGHNVPVGPYLADQLLIPLALGGGVFDTRPPSRHTLTNLVILERFGFKLRAGECAPRRWRIEHGAS